MQTLNEIRGFLKENYKYRIELHAHTKPISPCSEITPCEMVKRYKDKDFDAIVITNHFVKDYFFGDKEEIIDYYLKDYYETKQEGEKSGLLVLLGCELRFTENFNDYLVYGVDKEILSEAYDYFDKGLAEYRKNVKLEKSVLLQAHPFRSGMEKVDPHLLDGIETMNMHPGHNSKISFAIRYAAENDMKVKTIGSDFHHFGHEASGALRTRILPKDSFELAEILKSGDYIFEIGENAFVLP